VSIKVLDVTGRLIETRSSLSVGDAITVGGRYKPGSYIIEARQGRGKAIIKKVSKL